jgi:hypothetical protein
MNEAAAGQDLGEDVGQQPESAGMIIARTGDDAVAVPWPATRAPEFSRVSVTRAASARIPTCQRTVFTCSAT